LHLSNEYLAPRSSFRQKNPMTKPNTSSPSTPVRKTRIVEALPAVTPFIAPERTEMQRGKVFDARLGANELSFGPSPKALEAMQNALPEIWKYGIPDNEPIRSALAEHIGASPDEVTVGEGIDGLLSVLVRLYVEAGDAAVTTAGSYPVFNYFIDSVGGVLHMPPHKNDAEDLEALVAKAHEVNAKLLYVCNPSNPMGSVHTAQELEAVMEALPTDCLFVLDEAYAEFAPQTCIPAIDTKRQNVIRLRTFSKAYGLAGARIGYAIAPHDIISAFDKIRNHFGVNRMAQIGARAALADQSYLEKSQRRVKQGRERLAQIARDNGLSSLPSATNFVCIDCGKDGAYARALLKALEDLNVFVRMPSIAPLDRCIRVSVGSDAEMDIFENRLPIALKALA
jgi:histidinol-phosphate aminotransferase